MLNHPHKPSRHITEEERLDKVKTDLLDIKEKIKTNIIQNAQEQCDAETYYYCWSGLDLSVKLSILERKERLRDTIALFCTTKIHTVQKYTNQDETKTDADTWEGYKVVLHYPPKINVTEKDLNEEFDGAMKTVNGLYMVEINQARMQKREVSQLTVWQNFLSTHYIEYPGMGQLVQIMLATAGNTSPLERGYTYLEMIASKRRNKLLPENLETLFLLAALKIPTKKADMYTKEVDRLNGKSYLLGINACSVLSLLTCELSLFCCI